VEKQARTLGPTGYIQVKVESREGDPTPLGTISGTWSAKLNVARGGGNDDKMPWGVELVCRGTPTFDGMFDPDAA
jgi:hypothetical protein